MPRCHATAAALFTAAVLATTSAGCGGSPTTTADPAPAPSATTTPSADLQSAQADVGTLAPALEGFYRGGDYPRELDQVVASLEAADLDLSGDNELGAYRYDEEAVEFELCVQAPSGAWATYDTNPMALQQSGEEGGCPDL